MEQLHAFRQMMAVAWHNTLHCSCELLNTNTVTHCGSLTYRDLVTTLAGR